MRVFDIQGFNEQCFVRAENRFEVECAIEQIEGCCGSEVFDDIQGGWDISLYENYEQSRRMLRGMGMEIDVYSIDDFVYEMTR
jgi:hypothetical protein